MRDNTVRAIETQKLPRIELTKGLVSGIKKPIKLKSEMPIMPNSSVISTILNFFVTRITPVV